MTPPTPAEGRAHYRDTGHAVGSIPALSGPHETFYACLECPWPVDPAPEPLSLVRRSV